MKTIITYGTFDLFHEGHFNLLTRAKLLGDYLIVGVTDTQYDIRRGKKDVHDSLEIRISNVRNTNLADLIVIEKHEQQKQDDILKYNVDTFVVGDDWLGKFDYLSELCDVLYLSRTPGISSSIIRQQLMEMNMT